jgi:hypothetical protein
MRNIINAKKLIEMLGKSEKVAIQRAVINTIPHNLRSKLN